MTRTPDTIAPEDIAAAKKGDQDSWQKIYLAMAPLVLGYLRSRGAPEPEDLTAEVFLQVVRDIHGFEGEATEFRSWVFVITHHRMLDDARSRKRRPVQPADDETIARSSPVGDASVEAEGALVQAELRKMIDGLTAEQRDVLMLRIFGGMKIEEVAATMGKKAGAVQALQRRGLEALRNQMARKGVRF